MQKGPLIGAALLGITAIGIVVFAFVMMGGDTGEDLDHERVQHEVEDLKEPGEQHEVVGARPVTERPEDPVEAKIAGKWDDEQHGELVQADWDELKALKMMEDFQAMESVIEQHLSGFDGDKAAVRAAFEESQIKTRAVNAEVREGYLNPRQARKKHEAIRKAAEEAMVGELGEDGAQKLRKSLDARRLKFF